MRMTIIEHWLKGYMDEVLLETSIPEKEGRTDGGKIGRYRARTVSYVIPANL